MKRDVNIGRAGFCPSADVPASQNPFARIAETLGAWRTRAKQRAELVGSAPVLRRDLGLTDADIWREASKPFWRD